jgi:hypothetical protein
MLARILTLRQAELQKKHLPVLLQEATNNQEIQKLPSDWAEVFFSIKNRYS